MIAQLTACSPLHNCAGDASADCNASAGDDAWATPAVADVGGCDGRAGAPARCVCMGRAARLNQLMPRLGRMPAEGRALPKVQAPTARSRHRPPRPL